MQKICSHRKEVQASESLKKGDKWESWKQMLDRFDETELNQHIASGRVIYREDPVTWGLWQYKDTQLELRVECRQRQEVEAGSGVGI